MNYDDINVFQPNVINITKPVISLTLQFNYKT